MAKAYRPTITQTEFDATSGRLRADLKRWYDDRKDDPEAPPVNPETAGAFQHLPDIDSKAVVTTSPIIKKHLGVDLDPKLIRKGGYSSFDNMTGDLLPKLRASCPAAGVEARPQIGGAP